MEGQDPVVEKKDKKKQSKKDLRKSEHGIDMEAESDQLKNKKDQIKGDKKKEKKKEKEEKKKLKEEERQKEREEKLKEKEDKRKAEKKRELRKEQRKSWLAKNSGGTFTSDIDASTEGTPNIEPGPKDKKAPKQAQSPDIMRRQRELEQFLLNMPIKRLRGTSWQYYDIAPAAGYTESIVVLHGGGVRPETLYEYIIGFAQGLRVVAPRFPEVFTEMDDYVAGVFLIMRHENIKKSHFFGIGFGSLVALHCIYRHPARVISSSFIHLTLPNENKIRNVEKALKKMEFGHGPLSRLMAGYFVKPKDIEEHVVDLAIGEREMWIRNFKNFVATKQAVFSRLEAILDYHTNFSYAPQNFERWQGKMLFIESEDDEYFNNEDFTELTKLFPDSTQHLLKSCGHLYSLIRGKIIVDVILRFILDEDVYMDVTSKTDISPRDSEDGIDGLNMSGDADAPPDAEETKEKNETKNHQESSDKKKDSDEKKKKKDKDTHVEDKDSDKKKDSGEKKKKKDSHAEEKDSEKKDSEEKKKKKEKDKESQAEDKDSDKKKDSDEKKKKKDSHIEEKESDKKKDSDEKEKQKKKEKEPQAEDKDSDKKKDSDEEKKEKKKRDSSQPEEGKKKKKKAA